MGVYRVWQKKYPLKIFGNISSMTDDTERVYEVHAVKNFNLQILRRRTAAILKTEKVQYLKMT